MRMRRQESKLPFPGDVEELGTQVLRVIGYDRGSLDNAVVVRYYRSAGGCDGANCRYATTDETFS